MLGRTEFPVRIQSHLALTLRHHLLRIRNEDKEISWEGARIQWDSTMKLNRNLVMPLNVFVFGVARFRKFLNQKIFKEMSFFLGGIEGEGRSTICVNQAEHGAS